MEGYEEEMKNKFFSRFLAMLMTGMLFVGSMNVTAFAEEVTEAPAEGEAAAEEVELEALDGYVEGELDTSDGEVAMSGIASSNGRVIASAFPDSFLPDGFKKDTCTYEGQTIEIARMISDTSGEVVLAYLADDDGSNGDFYLCDIMTAEMSDFIQIKNGNEGYIIVLDPGDVIVAPSGFRRAEFQYYGKTGVAWRLPSKDGNKTASALIQNPFAPVPVYAASAGAGALDSILSTVTNSDKKNDEQSAEAESGEEAAGDASEAGDSPKASAAEAEDGSRIVAANPAEFIMVYAVDNTGTVGFYLYDTVQETYQRYVEIEGADAAMIQQYQKDAKIRLIIICVLAVILVIMLFVIVNILLNRRDDYDDEDDEDEDDVDAVRRSVERKAKAFAAPVPSEPEYEEDEEYEEEAEEEEEEIPQPVKPQRAPARRNMRHLMDIEDADEDEEYAYKQSPRKAAPVRAERKPAPRAEEPVREASKEGPRFTRNGQPVKRTGVPQSGARVEEGTVPAQKAPRGEANVVRRSAGSAGAPVRRPSSSRENVERRPVTGPSRRSAGGAERRPGQARPSAEARRPRAKADFDDDFEFEFIDIDE